IIDFSQFPIGAKAHLVNLADHFDPDPTHSPLDGKMVHQDLTLAQALSGTSQDPGVGRFLEFRVVRNPSQPDLSRVPATMIPNPDLSGIPVSRERTFVFGRDAINPSNDPLTSFIGPWGIGVDSELKLDADYGRISALPQFGTREIWHLVNGGG